MTDQLIMNNYLLVLKSTIEVFVHGTLESSNEGSRNVLKECLVDTLTNQANTYDLMTKYGWYNVKNVDATKVNETLNNIKSKN